MPEKRPFRGHAEWYVAVRHPPAEGRPLGAAGRSWESSWGNWAKSLQYRARVPLWRRETATEWPTSQEAWTTPWGADRWL